MQDTNLKECDENLPIKVREAFREFTWLFQQAKEAGYDVRLFDKEEVYSAYHIRLTTTNPKCLKLTISKTTCF